MPAFLGLAVQSDVRCASGSTVAFFPPEDLKACAAVLSPTEPESLQFTIPRSDTRASELTLGRVVRTRFTSGTLDREWDITDVDDSGADDELKVTASPIALRLAKVVFQAANASSGAPEFVFDETAAAITIIIDDRVLPACTAAGMSWIERGTVDSAALVDLSSEWTSVAEIMAALADAGRGDGEWQLRRDGDSRYLLDLVDAIGSSAATVRVRTAMNLLESKRTRSLADAATRLIPRGSADSVERTIAAHLWKITVVNGTTLSLADIAGGDGPILYDDQLNGLYIAILNSHTFASVVITDSDAATQRVTIASTAGMTTGQWCRFFVGSGANGARVVSLARPLMVVAPSAGGLGDRARILDRSALRFDCNLVPNPSMRDYAGASSAPDGWTYTEGTPANAAIARESTIVRESPYTARITTTGDTTLSLETADIRPWATAGRRYAAGLWFNIQTVPADVTSALIFEITTAAGVLIQEIGRWVRGDNPATALNTWIRFAPDVLNLESITSAVRLRVRIARTGNTSAQSGWDVIFGPALLAESEVGGVADIDYSGGTKGWQEANRELALVSSAIKGYDLDVLDMERDDAATFADYAFTPGGTVEVTDQDLAEVVSLRLLEYRPDYLNPLGAEIKVGVLPPDVAREVADPSPTTPAPATPLDTPVPVDGLVQRVKVSASTAESGTTGTLTLEIRDPSSLVRVVEYRTLSARGDWSAWAAMTQAARSRYTATVTMVEKVPARLNWRVRGIETLDADDGREDVVLAEDTVTFAMGPAPLPPIIEAAVREDGSVDVALIGDIDTASLQIGFSTVSQAAANAALGSTQNARQYKFQSVGSLTLGQKGYLAAKAWSATGAGGTGSIVAEAEVIRFNVTGSRIVRLAAASALQPYTEAAQYTRTTEYLEVTGIVSFVGYQTTLPLPKDATLTAVRARVWIDNPAGLGSYAFWRLGVRRVEQSGSYTSLGTDDSATNAAWETVEVGSLSEDTSGDRSYIAICTPTTDGTDIPARIAWIEYDYDYPDVTVS